jgi:hypothetical protein
VTLSANPGGLTAGTYACQLTVSTSRAVQTVPVNLAVAAPPTFVVSSTSLAFTYAVGGGPAPAQSVSVTSTSTPLQFTITTASSGWLAAAVDATVTPAKITTRVYAAGLAAGVYNGTIMIAGSSGTRIISVLLNGLPSSGPAGQGNPMFVLDGSAAELPAVSNGAPLVAALAPSGISGNLVLKGTGQVNFDAPVGVRFATGGQQNKNTAFYQFIGAATGSLFDRQSAGEVSFSWKSAYSFAERVALNNLGGKQARTAFEVWDDSALQMKVTSDPSTGKIAILYGSSTYSLPTGQEDALFGKNVTLNVRVHWDGATIALYLNDKQVASTKYTYKAPNWTAKSSLSIGAQDSHVSGGGFYASDDTISNFQVVRY